MKQGAALSATREEVEVAPGADFWVAMHEFVMEGTLLLRGLTQRQQLSFVQYMTLQIIAHGGSSRPSELAEEFGVSPPAVTFLTSGLEARGLVARRHDPLDRRTVRLSLTPKGVRVLGSIVADRQEVLNRIRAGVPEGRASELAGTLRRLTEGLREERARTGLLRARSKTA